MYLEVIQWPESQEVMDDPEWFFIQGGVEDAVDPSEDPIGSLAYARILNEDDLKELAEKHFDIDKKEYVSNEEFLKRNQDSRRNV